MAGVIRSLVTRILFKSDPTGLKKVTTHATEAKRQMRAASRAAWKLKRDLREVGSGLRNWAVGFAVGGFAVKKLIDGFAKGTDETAKFARSLGISLQELQGMQHAARLNGVSIAELNVALPKLAQNAGNAADGSKAAADAFRRAGVDVKDSITKKFKDPIQLMNELADSFKAGRFQGNKTQVLMNLFGRSGKKMGVLLAQGSEGIKKAAIEARKLGIVLSASEAKIAEDYNDEMLRTKSVLAGLRNQIMVKLLPAVNRNLKAFVAWAKEGDNLKKTTDALIKSVKVLAVVLAAAAAAKLGQTIFALVQITKKAVFWTRLQGKVTLIAYAPYIAIAAAIAALVLIIQSLVVWSRGGKSAVGDLFEHFGIADKARKVVDALGKAWRAFVAFLPAAQKHLVRVLVAMRSVLSALWDEFGADLTDLGVALVALFREIYPVMVSIAETAHAAMLVMIAALGKAWREEIKPAIIEVGKALGDLWIAAKPVTDALIGAAKTWLGWMWQAILVVIPLIKDAFVGTFKVVSMVIKGSIRSLTALVKMVTFVVNKMKRAFDIATSIIGLGGEVDLGSSIGGTVRPASAGGRGLQRTTSNTLSVGTMSVSVQGTANMTPAEFHAAVEAGTKKVFQNEVNDAFNAIRSLVPA